MPREGPGFIEDLVLLWLTLGAWVIVAEVVITALNLSGIVATVAGVGIGAVIAFVVLYGYYRYFLDEKPLQQS